MAMMAGRVSVVSQWKGGGGDSSGPEFLDLIRAAVGMCVEKGVSLSLNSLLQWIGRVAEWVHVLNSTDESLSPCHGEGQIKRLSRAPHNDESHNGGCLGFGSSRSYNSSFDGSLMIRPNLDKRLLRCERLFVRSRRGSSEAQWPERDRADMLKQSRRRHPIILAGPPVTDVGQQVDVVPVNDRCALPR